MIILRQKEYGKKKHSFHYSQIEIGSGRKDHSDYRSLDGRLVPDSENNKTAKKFFEKSWKMPRNPGTGATGNVKVKGNYIFIETHQGKDIKSGRQKQFQSFISNKSPKEAYRDWLRSIDQRMKFGDLSQTEPSISNKEVKERLRKELKKRNLRRAVGLSIGGALVTAGTIAGVKAIKKHKKKDKKK